MGQPPSPIQVLACIRKAYPHGVVPGTDYPALLAVLRKHLPVEDTTRIATELVVQGVNAVTGTDLQAAIGSVLPNLAGAPEMARITRRLRSAGWNLAED